jgi:HAD superfamily hydrolase (TIGR01450 family)
MLSDIAVVAFDLDGVVWRDFVEIPYAREVIDHLREFGLTVCFVSNYSNRSREYLCERLADIGISACSTEMFTAATLATVHLRSTETGQRNYVTIEDGDALASEFESFGMSAVPLSNYDGDSGSDPCAVVVGYGRKFGYADVARLLRISDRVEGLFATGRDRWYGSSEGPVPASGWIVAATEEILDRRAITLGKPNPLALRTVARSLGIPVGRVLMVGDSVQADVAAASNAGAISCLFRDSAQRSSATINNGPVADYEITDLRELVHLLT